MAGKAFQNRFVTIIAPGEIVCDPAPPVNRTPWERQLPFIAWGWRNESPDWRLFSRHCKPEISIFAKLFAHLAIFEAQCVIHARSHF